MKISESHKGSILTLVLSLILLVIFFGKVLFNLNHVYFQNGGDGLQIYVNSIYHIRYDAGYMVQQNMNYPYGEKVFFTNLFIPLINTLKFFKNNGLDLSGYTVGIINATMLFSIPLCAYILFLIFTRLKLPWIYSCLVSVAIAFLSPQIKRFEAHFLLSYSFVIPLIFYLLLLFYEKRKVRYSVYIAAAAVFISLIQFYYFALIACIVSVFWIYLLIADKFYKNFRTLFLNVFLQLIFPFLIITVLTTIVDDFPNRTNHPWGFFYYRTFWQGVFLPLQTIMGPLFSKMFYGYKSNEEAISYVGFMATLLLVFLVIRILWKSISLSNIKSILRISDHPSINAFFWGGLVALFIALGYPFEGYLQVVAYYLGPVKQIRSVGRFVWIFYYAANITAFYMLYKIAEKYSTKIKYSMIGVGIFLISINVFVHLFGFQDRLNNYIADLEDHENKKIFNSSISKLTISNYQAFIPIPYIHSGSESAWRLPEECLFLCNKFFILPVKSGLPTTAAFLSRTSITQSYNNLAMLWEPYRPLKIVEDFPDKRPLLVMAREEQLVNNYEKEFLSKCNFLFKGGTLSFYEISFDSLKNISNKLGSKTLKEIEKSHVSQNSYFSKDSTQNYFIEDFNTNKNSSIAYRGEGCKLVPTRGENLVCEKAITIDAVQSYTLNFWFGDITKDLFGRTIFIVEILKDGNIVFSEQDVISRKIVTLDGDWALIESVVPFQKIGNYTFRLKFINTIEYENYIPGKETIRVDELLIRPSGVNVYRLNKNEIYKNCRYYPLSN